jgi:hypothetical protein
MPTDGRLPLSAGGEQVVNNVAPDLFTARNGEEVVENKTFHLCEIAAWSSTFFGRTVESAAA